MILLKEMISHYRLLEKLGAGGMGEVYLAEDITLGRTVALKILRTDLAHDRDHLRRFLQEARAAAALHHPNVAHIYEIGEFKGINFIVMEYVEGPTLDAKINHRPLDVGEIIEIGIEIADALAEAHAKGVTHRDIKPTNIRLTLRGEVKVLDFGLAKITSIAGAELKSATRDVSTQIKTTPGMVMGTVQYMSPEQAMGRGVDHRSDIFSLGVVVYEMATGRLPFSGETATEIIDHISHMQPEAIARFNYGVSTELEHIIRKCLEKEKERRYQSAGELLVDLKNLQRDITASGGTATPSRRKRSRKSINSLAVLPLVNASADPNAEYLSDGITESIINSLAQLPQLRVMARSTVFRYKGREVDPQEVGRDLNVRAVLVGRVLHLDNRLVIKTELVDTTNGAQLWGRHYDRSSSDILAVQEEIAMEISEKLQIKLTVHEQKRVIKRYTENTEAYEAYLKGHYYWNKRTAEGFKKGIEYFERAIEADKTYALAYTGLADSYILLNYLPPTEVMPKARAALLKALEIDDLLAEAHASLAKVKDNYDWDWPGAESEYRRALALNPNYATARQWYAEHLAIGCHHREALAEIKKAQALDPLSLSISNSIARQLFFARRYDEAIAQCLHTLEMDQNFLPARYRLGCIYMQKKMHREAIAELEKTLELSDGEMPIRAALGSAYAAAGRKLEAHKIIADLHRTAPKSFINPAHFSQIYLSLGETDEAFAWLEEVYAGRFPLMIYLKVDPVFDSLRSDARFTNLLRRVGLPP